jgi:hypothetical protein
MIQTTRALRGDIRYLYQLFNISLFRGKFINSEGRRHTMKRKIKSTFIKFSMKVINYEAAKNRMFGLCAS